MVAAVSSTAMQCDKDIRHWEEAWTREADFYPTTPRGDCVTVSRQLWAKYGEDCLNLDKVGLAIRRVRGTRCGCSPVPPLAS